LPPSLNWDAPIPELGWKGKGKLQWMFFCSVGFFPQTIPPLGWKGKCDGCSS